jgi:hypothetical protein
MFDIDVTPYAIAISGQRSRHPAAREKAEKIIFFSIFFSSSPLEVGNGLHVRRHFVESLSLLGKLCHVHVRIAAHLC